MNGVLDWVNVSIGDPLRDFASTYVMGIEAATRMMPERAAEFEYRVSRALEYYRSKVDLDESRFRYYQAFKCLMVMFAYEHGVEFYGLFGIIDAIVQYFTDLTGVKIHLK